MKKRAAEKQLNEYIEAMRKYMHKEILEAEFIEEEYKVMSVLGIENTEEGRSYFYPVMSETAAYIHNECTKEDVLSIMERLSVVNRG